MPEDEIDGSENPENLSGPDYSEEIEPEIEPEPDPPTEEPEPALEPEPQPIAQYRPRVSSGNAALDAIAEEYGDPRLAELIRQAVQHEQREGFAAAQYADDFQRQVAEVAPDWHRQNRAAIREAENVLPPAMRGTPAAAVFAFAAPAMRHAEETGDVAEAVRMLQRTAQRMPAAPPQQPRQPQRELSPSERIPSSGGGSTAPVRQPERRPARGAVGVIAELTGLDSDEVSGYVPHMRRRE